MFCTNMNDKKKIDLSTFKLHFCIIRHVLFFNSRDAFAKLLSSGDLTEKYSSQFTTVDSEIAPVLAKICFFNHFSGKSFFWASFDLLSKKIRKFENICRFLILTQCVVFLVVEQVERSASLYSKSIQGHDVCLLVKQLVSFFEVQLFLSSK